jgi:tRNA(fMet)-specific endonuclease VapC
MEFSNHKTFPITKNNIQIVMKIIEILESKGCSIGPYDLMLAGHALALGLTFVTRNLREFKRVDGLILENWES